MTTTPSDNFPQDTGATHSAAFMLTAHGLILTAAFYLAVVAYLGLMVGEPLVWKAAVVSLALTYCCYLVQLWAWRTAALVLSGMSIIVGALAGILLILK